jgi:beta-galactosidase
MFRKFVTLLVISTILFFNLSAQNSNESSGESDKNKDSEQPYNFFPSEELMQVGAFYYPEQWPKEQWGRDLSNMAKFGFDFTHFAEFSWAFLEPEEGMYDFAWLDKAVDLADKAGLKVIMCTPSLAPPAWMGEKYPEIYLVGMDGRRKEHGIRAHASITNPIYRNFVNRIAKELVQHYGNDPRICGWQLDNEPLAVPDYSPSARMAFQKWLKNKYGTIDKLNEVWVGSFWSTRYDNFEQVLIPNEGMNDEDKLSPHSLLDFKRFTADATAYFLDEQAEIIHKSKLPSHYITTNYVNATTDSDPRRTSKLDFPCFTLYLVSGHNHLGGINFRTGNPYRLYEACDYFRPISGVTGIMELQPGQVNWASINPMLQPGTVHMWIMQALGGGCSFVCTYRYRSPLRHSEMYHDGIVGTDGVSLSQGGKEFVQAIADIKKLRAVAKLKAVTPGKIAKRKTAILWSHDVMWDLNIQKQTYLWNTWQNRNKYSSIVKSAGAPVDFISENDDFSAYPFLLAPAYQLVDAQLVGKWTKYVENGGHLILSCRTGQKDKNGHFFEGQLAEPIRALIGADLEFFDMLLPTNKGLVEATNGNYEWNSWGEIIVPHPGTKVLATYADQFYKGKAAVTSRNLGKGTVTFIGVSTKDGELEKEIVRAVYEQANVAIEDLPKGVYLEWHDGFYVGVNYTNTIFQMPISENCRILIGENPLCPAEAVVWMEK